jgi:uncharacterized protein (DUF1499 family)
MALIRAILYIGAILLALLLLAGRFGLLVGRVPADLGVKDGKLKPPSATRNSVSSQADLYPDHPQRAYARIAPFTVQGTGDQSLKRLSQLLKGMAGVTLVTQTDDYLHAQCQTRWLRFTDDLELWLEPDGKLIQVRSASRLGREDFGVNRERVEALRAAFEAKALTP